MPIAKKPTGDLKDITEKEVDTFIEGAGKRERKGNACLSSCVLTPIF